MPQKLKVLLVFLTLAVGLIVRLYKIDNPIADWHSFRQADTASVTRSFLNNGINMFVPTYHDLSILQSGVENPKGYRMVEFPIYNLLSLGVYKAYSLITHASNLDVTSRLTSIIISLLASLCIFKFVSDLTKRFWLGYFSFAVYLFLPFSIYYSRAVLPEQTAVLFMMLSLVLFRKNLLLSAVSLSLSFLVKPYTGIIAFPIFVYLSYTYYLKNLEIKKIIYLVFFAIISLIPFLLWRRWIQNFPSGIPQSDWLFWTDPKNQHLLWFKGYNLTWIASLIPFKPYWFRWIFYQRLTLLILGSFGLIPLFLSLAYKDKHLQKINLLSVLGFTLYFVIVAGGNVRHDYYQVLIIPFLSIIIATGLYYIANHMFVSKVISIFLLFLVSSFTFLSCWNQVSGYYAINNPTIVDVGKTVDQLLPKNALVVAPYNGDTAFLYQTHRSGWPIEIYDFDKIKNDHSQNPIYLVSISNDNYTNNVAANFATLHKNDKLIIIDLQHENQK